MNLSTDRIANVVVVRVNEARMMYPLLSDFSQTVSGLIAAGDRRLVIDLAQVGYIDSATIGCLMDIYRQVTPEGGGVRLINVQRRVETMLTMTGAQNFIEVHASEQSALDSFGGAHANN